MSDKRTLEIKKEIEFSEKVCSFVLSDVNNGECMFTEYLSKLGMDINMATTYDFAEFLLSITPEHIKPKEMAE